MSNIFLGGSALKVSSIGLGCMRIKDMSLREAEALINTAVECGINFFDNADVYGAGECERLFGEVLKANHSLRENIVIQSKCGISNGLFDFSKKHIIEAVDGILDRLRTDYIEVLLLHRPDALMEPEEVAEAFNILQESGKVNFFGVSNQKPMQIELLSKYVDQKLVANQLQLSITNATMISNGMNVNMLNDSAVDRDGSVLDYCRLNDITIQPWSPFQHGFFDGAFLGNDKFKKLNDKIAEIAKKYNVCDSAVVIAWLLRHPAKMQPIIGTTNLDRVRDISKAYEFTLTREEWYDIYKAAGNVLP